MPKTVKVRARGEAGTGVVYYPLAQELDYAVAAVRRSRRLTASLRAVISQTAGKGALRLIDALEREIAATSFTPEILRASKAVESFSTAQTARIVSEAVAIDPRKIRNALTGEPLAPMLKSWAGMNAELITGIDTRQIAEVRDLVEQAVSSGQSAKTLAKLMAERGLVAESRARLIARDQIGKLNAAVSASRQQSLGVVSYTWQTALDERVRPAHRARQGEVFNWAEPPSDGHPGEPINCRCVARPIVPEEISLFED